LEADEAHGMKPSPDPRAGLPAEAVSHAVWLYHMFSLGLLDRHLLPAERGITVSSGTVRR